MTDRPWHVAVVAWLAILWHIVVAADYVLTQYRIEAYVTLFSEEQQAYFFGMPAWANGAWGLGTWAGLAASSALLWCWRRVPLLFFASLAGMAVVAVWFLVLADPVIGVVTGPVGTIAIAAGVVVPLVLWVYARACHAAGVIP